LLLAAIGRLLAASDIENKNAAISRDRGVSILAVARRNVPRAPSLEHHVLPIGGGHL